jgi:voltage-gated potassium channel
VFIPIIVLPFIVELSPEADLSFDVASGFIWAMFVLEYVGLLYLAPRRGHMVRTHLLDLVVIVVPMLRPFRLLRLSRLLALVGRAITALQRINDRPGFRGFLVLVVLTIVVSGLVATSFEDDDPTSSIQTIGEGLWWAVVTVTTVGYGDFVPVTTAGRTIGVVLMFVGIALFSAVTANVAAFFVQSDEKPELTELRELLLRQRPSEVPLVADELTKLDALRERGVLTGVEFEDHKRRLLASIPGLDERSSGPDPPTREPDPTT